MNCFLTRNVVPGPTLMLLVVGAASLLWAPINGFSQDVPQIKWRADYDSARKESADKDLPMFVEFQTDTCIHCRRLEQETFADKGIIDKLNQHFVPLKVNASLFPRLVSALQIKLYPTMVIASPDGKIVGFIEGYQDVKALDGQLQKIIEQATPTWMVQKQEAAEKAVEEGNYLLAMQHLQLILKDGKERTIQKKAKLLQAEIDQLAAARLVRIQQVVKRGDNDTAADLLTDLQLRFAGTKAALASAKEFPADHEIFTAQANQEQRQVRDLLVQAKTAYQKERYHDALEVCRLIESLHADTPEGKIARDMVADIHADPAKLEAATISLNEKLAESYLYLAESFLEKGEQHAAALYFERAVRTAPASVVAREAQLKLVRLQPRTVATPASLKKEK
ncbi:MAG: thioredoxin family protein [Zavarzinella sp.]